MAATEDDSREIELEETDEEPTEFIDDLDEDEAVVVADVETLEEYAEKAETMSMDAVATGAHSHSITSR